MMTRRLVPIAVLTALTACGSITYEEPSPVTTPEPETVKGIDIPDSPPMRDAYTTYLKVARDGVTIGYVVRYDEPPTRTDVARRYKAGTMFVENSKFERVGFITSLGRAYRFRGADSEEVGQGTLEELLPTYFGEKGELEVTPLSQS